MKAWRKLRKEEVDLIAAILSDSPKANEILPSLPGCLVEDMAYGLWNKTIGSGALEKKIAEAEFTDEEVSPSVQS